MACFCAIFEKSVFSDRFFKKWRRTARGADFHENAKSAFYLKGTYPAQQFDSETVAPRADFAGTAHGVKKQTKQKRGFSSDTYSRVIRPNNGDRI